MQADCHRGQNGKGSALARAGTAHWADLLALVGLVGLVGGLVVYQLLPSVTIDRQPTRRTECLNNLRQIAIALHYYHDKYDSLPPAYTVDAFGNPLHSWRTLILPQLGHESLYDSIDLSKPWNDPANEEAFNTRVNVYHCPSGHGPPHHTTYLANAAKDGCFRPLQPLSFSEITDPQGQTLLVLEVPLDQSIPWMAPTDADDLLIMAIGSQRSGKMAHTGGGHAAMADGRVVFLSEYTPAATRRALITIWAGDGFEDIPETRVMPRDHDGLEA